ncbi:hypothetical protein [Streptomyces sp. N50]|uniref:hypothetical protein n=1 Tax=Streptomyces sp. N50 TaxID=3081765 RepID=UPI0029624FDB|nr:hypothetical protein [Streptomyces sp. N50]WOX16474.1 hypothetical protein R2B38_47570 [Streptomyces sp. N50]
MTYELRATHGTTRFYGRLNGAELLGLSAVLVAAYVLVHARLADVGAATTAALFFVGPFDPVNMTLGRLRQCAAGGGRPRQDRRRHARRTRTGRTSGGPGTALVVQDVHHRYGTGPDVLHGVRLELPAGQRLAIVSATGSGKSTPATGAPDGRRRIMLVTQDHHLFLGTVADNLRLARRDASPSDLTAALAALAATGWIDALRAA